MTVRQEGQQSVRDILATIHPTAQTLKDIGITKENKTFLTQANVTIEGDSDSERSVDAEEMFRVIQSLEKGQAQEKAKVVEVDLGYIDLFEPDPAHYAQAHANKKLSTQWTIEESIASPV